jgi:hypothetical protein
MAIFEAMSLLALEPLLRTRCSTSPDAANELPAPMPDPADLRIALARASDNAWRVLEVLLAGPAFWRACHLYLSEGEWSELSQQAQFLREKLRFRPDELGGEGQRRQCLRELHQARQKQLLAEPPAEAVSTRRLPAEPPAGTAFAVLLRELRQAGLTNLARLLEHDDQPEPLLGRAVQHFLQHELEQEPRLLPGAAPSSAGLPASQSYKGFQLVAQALARFGPGLQEWIEEDMSETPASASDTNTPSVPATVAEKSVTNATQPGRAAAAKAPRPTSPPQDPRPTQRQRRWAWLFALLVLLVPVALVCMYVSRFWAHEECVYTGPQLQVTWVSFSPDGRLVAAASIDGAIYVWHRDTGHLVQKLFPDSGKAWWVGFSPDGRTLLTADEGAPRVYDVESWSLLKRIDVLRNFIICAAYSPRGDLFATSSAAEGTASKKEGAIHLWDAKTHKELRVLSNHDNLVYKNPVGSIAFSPDGKLLLATDGKLLCLWDVDSGERVDTIKTPPDFMITVAAFAPDGNHIAFAGYQWDEDMQPQQPIIVVLDRQGNKEPVTLNGHMCPIVSLAFSPDSQYIASSSLGQLRDQEGKLSGPEEPRTVRLWSLTTGQECRHFETKIGVASVAFSPDGQHLLTGGANKMVRLWSLSLP